MKPIWFTRLSSLLLLLFLFGISGCEDNTYVDPGSSSTTSSNLSEQKAIQIVKDYLKVVSQTRLENQQVMERKPCSAQMAAVNSSCKPCAPGSPNYCVDEWVTKAVQVPGSCPFPPSKDASWSANYNDGAKEWDVQSNDPYSTGTNNWTVDDQNGEVLSGYCVIH